MRTPQQSVLTIYDEREGRKEIALHTADVKEQRQPICDLKSVTLAGPIGSSTPA